MSFPRRREPRPACSQTAKCRKLSFLPLTPQRRPRLLNQFLNVHTLPHLRRAIVGPLVPVRCPAQKLDQDFKMTKPRLAGRLVRGEILGFAQKGGLLCRAAIGIAHPFDITGQIAQKFGAQGRDGIVH